MNNVKSIWKEFAYTDDDYVAAATALRVAREAWFTAVRERCADPKVWGTNVDVHRVAYDHALTGARHEEDRILEARRREQEAKQRVENQRRIRARGARV